jgi:hypothetical protein
LARISAQRLGFELLTQSRIRALTDEEFGAGARIPDKAYPSLATSILARLATQHHLVYCAVGGELQARHFPGMLRVHVVAPENIRIGNLMFDRRVERAAARQLLLELEAADRADRKAKFGKTKATADLFDLVLNAESLTSEQMAELIETTVASAGLKERGFLSAAAAAQLQFQMRLKLARYGIVPTGTLRCARRCSPIRARRCSPTCWTFTASPGSTSRAAFPCSGPRRRGSGIVHPRFLPAGIRSLRGADHHEAVARDHEEPQGAAAARTVPAPEHPGLLPEGF